MRSKQTLSACSVRLLVLRLAAETCSLAWWRRYTCAISPLLADMQSMKVFACALQGSCNHAGMYRNQPKPTG